MSGRQPALGLFAYPSAPRSIGETIAAAIQEVNLAGVAMLQPWEACRVGGVVVIDEICKAIEAAPLFCADLTGINPNVMFELGYAIATGRRVWLILDRSLSESRAAFEQLRMLTTIGYADYRNSHDIVREFYKDQPYGDLGNTIFTNAIEPQLADIRPIDLLYLKSLHNTEASVRITRRVNGATLSTVIDDPEEVSAQTLAWYGAHVFSATGVLCHLTARERDGARIQNARHSFAAGMAAGFGKRLLMATEGPVLAPIDYRDRVREYTRPTEAIRQVEPWIAALESEVREQRRRATGHAAVSRLASQLRDLRFGEYIAENEAREIVEEYFVETAAYREGLQARGTVFVGRKGSGKTANLLKLADAIGTDARVMVCVIRPVAYELDSIVELAKGYLTRERKGYALESVWKFLIYAEVANQVGITIGAKPLLARSGAENQLMAILDRDGGWLRSDFAVRLERCVASLRTLGTSAGAPIGEARAGISEALHRGILGELRDAIVSALAGRRRICILVDNLDKAWERRDDIDILVEFLLGLLSAARRIADDLRRVRLKGAPAEVSLLVFVRSDIFETLRRVAREPDKIVSSVLDWSDRELLLRVMEERFVASHEGNVGPDVLWEDYFVPEIGGMPTREYLVSRILPRPRDLLFLAKAAVAAAVNRGHGRVEAEDIEQGERDYSAFAVDTVLIESDLPREKTEAVLYEFIGSPALLSIGEVETRLGRAGVAGEEAGAMVARLCRLGFLLLEVGQGQFRVAEGAGELRRAEMLARQWCEDSGQAQRFSIGVAFRKFLEVRE